MRPSLGSPLTLFVGAAATASAAAFMDFTATASGATEKSARVSMIMLDASVDARSSSSNTECDN